MFSAILLLCNTAGSCMGLASPSIFSSLEACEAAVGEGILFFNEDRPDLVVSDWKCIAWGKPA